MYTIVIQLGAILCLPVYFRARIAKLLSTFPQGERGDRNALTHPLGLTTVAFVTTAIPAFLLTKVIGKHLESLKIIGASLLLGGIVMWIVDAWNARAEAAGPSTPGPIHTWKMEDTEPAPGPVDRRLPDSFRRLSRHLAFHVHNRGRAGCRNVAGGCA